MKKRKGWIDNGIGYIPLTQGQVAIVDTVSVSCLEKWNWCAVWNARMKAYYAFRSDVIDGKPTTIPMHRFVVGLASGDKRQVDHKNGNTLDNRMDNLRAATASQNAMNRGIQSNNKAGLKGITWHARTKTWRADIGAYGKDKTIGYFKTKEEAHEAYCKAAKELHGEFFRIESVKR